MKKRIKNLMLVMVLFFVWAFVSGNAWAIKDPMTILKENQKNIRKILSKEVKKGDKKARQKQAQKIKHLIEPFFDFDRLAEKALGKHWAKRTKAERIDYKFWLKALLENAYLQSLKLSSGKKNTRKIKIKYRKQKIHKNKATVFTRLQYRNKRNRRKKIRIDWVFYKKDHSWLVSDIITNDNGLIETYEEMFDKIIKKKSFADLLRRIKRKVNRIRKKAGMKPLTAPSEKKAKS